MKFVYYHYYIGGKIYINSGCGIEANIAPCSYYYFLICLGMFTIPFNMVANTPIQCTLDRNAPNFTDSMLGSRAYVRKYCIIT